MAVNTHLAEHHKQYHCQASLQVYGRIIILQIEGIILRDAPYSSLSGPGRLARENQNTLCMLWQGRGRLGGAG